MDEWQPASVALATPHAASPRTVVGRHFPTPQPPTRRPRLSPVQSVAEYGCTLNLPGSVITPARFVADPAISRLAGPGAAGAVHVRRPRSPPPAMPAQPRWSPPDPQRPGPWSSRNAAHHNPDSGSGLAPATPAQGCCWGCQLAAARCSLAAAVIASAAANSSRSRATSWSEGGPSSPDPRRASARLPYRTARPGQLLPGASVRFPQFRNARSGHWLTPRSLFLPKSADILTNPSD